MDNKALQNYIHQHIPILITLWIKVYEISKNKVILGAPLIPNINHKQTACGGSLQSVLT